MQKNLPWGLCHGDICHGDRYLAATTERQSAMGTGTWQQQPSANGCQVPVPWQGRCVISTAFLPTLGYRPHTVYTVDHQ